MNGIDKCHFIPFLGGSHLWEKSGKQCCLPERQNANNENKYFVEYDNGCMYSSCNGKGSFRILNLNFYLLIVDKGWVGGSRKHP